MSGNILPSKCSNSGPAKEHSFSSIAVARCLSFILDRLTELQDNVISELSWLSACATALATNTAPRSERQT